MHYHAVALLLSAAFVQACIPAATSDAVCDGELQSAEQNYPTTGAGGVDAPWDLDGDGTFDDTNPDCVEAYDAAKLDCDDDDPSVSGDATEVACNGKDDDCDPATPDLVDADADEVCDASDTCPGFDDRLDADADGTPNNCDPCPDDAGDDSDGDGSCDSVDLCPGFDDAIDSDNDTVADGCDFCVGNDPGERFSDNMVGCLGVVTFPARATLCTAGFTVCTGQQWVDRRDSAAPTYNYWTDDVLGYIGSFGACSVSTSPDYDCAENEPMRVCGSTFDALGNVCNWTDCTWDRGEVNAYFGGCDGNTTAGALCCR